MDRNQIDRDVIRRCVEEAIAWDSVLLSHRIGRKVRPYLQRNQTESDHVTLIVNRCIAKGFIERIGRGRFKMTAAGLAWCRADSVTNLP